MAYLGPSLRREKRTERPRRRAAAAVAASLALNAALLWALAVSGAFRLQPAAGSSRVALARIDSAQWEANRKVGGAAPDRKEPAPAARPEAQEEEARAEGQVVDVAPPKDARRPKESRFLAEHDSTVERETRSRFAGRKYEHTLPVPQEGARGATARPVPGEEKAAGGERGEDGPAKAQGERVARAPRPD